MTPNPAPTRTPGRLGNSLVPLAAVLAGLVTGFNVGQPDAPSPLPASETRLFPLTQQPASAPLPAIRPATDPLTRADGFALSPAEAGKRIEHLLARPDALQSALLRTELTDLLTQLASRDAGSALQFALQLPDNDVGGAIQKAVVAAAFAAQPGDVRARIEGMTAAPARFRLLQHLAAAMVESSPDQALELALKEGLLRDTAGSDAIFLRWAEQDPIAASRALSRLPLQFQQRNAAAAIAAAWVRSEPDAALAWAASLSPRSVRENALMAGIAQVAAADPQRAMTLASQHPGESGQSLQSAVLHAWCDHDVAAATAFTRSLPPGPQRDRWLASIGSRLILDDPEQAAQLLRELGTTRAAFPLAATMAATWAEIDPQATLAWVKGLPPSLQEAALKDSLLRLAVNAPEAAALFAEQATATPVLADSVGFIVAGLAAKDPAAAFAWCERLPAGTLVLQAREAALERWTARDPAAALAAALAVQTPDRTRLVEKVTTDWSRSDPGAALAWARQQPGDTGVRCAAVALAQLATKDAPSARAHLDEWIQSAGGLPPLEKSLPGVQHPLVDAAATVTSALAHTDPVAATAWARQLPEGEVRKEVLSRHFCDWAAVAPKDAETYASTLPGGWERDWTLVSALFTYTEQPNTHADALRVAGLLADPTERARAVRLIRGVAPDWPAARTQLLQAGYTPGEIESAGQ